MKIVPFIYEEHANEVKAWGAKHEFPLPPKEFLPDVGLVVNDAAVGFVYTTNSKMAWIEWVFANPDKTAEERKESLDHLMSALEKVAIIGGMKVLFSASGTHAYREILGRNGFQETDKNMIHHVKGIG